MQCIRRELQHAVLHEDTHIVHEEEAVLAKIIHARPTNILILRKISLFYPPPVAYTAGAAIAAFFILATALSVSWRLGSPSLLWYEFNERESVNLELALN